MKSAFKYLQEIFYLVSEDRSKLLYIVLLFFILSIFDLVGLGLIAPYISLVIEPESLKSGWFFKIFESLGWNKDYNTQIYRLSILLIILFLGKMILAIIINDLIIRFAHRQLIRVQSKLMDNYQNLPYSIYLQRNSAEYINSVNNYTNQYQSILQQLMKHQ